MHSSDAVAERHDTAHFGDIHLVADWTNDGQRIEAYLLDRYPYLGTSAAWILHPESNYFAPGKARDSLTYDDLQVHPLTPDLAYATARFRLLDGDSVSASGPFTLILQRRGERWVILHDHTSSDAAP